MVCWLIKKLLLHFQCGSVQIKYFFPKLIMLNKLFKKNFIYLPADLVVILI